MEIMIAKIDYIMFVYDLQIVKWIMKLMRNFRRTAKFKKKRKFIIILRLVCVIDDEAR